MEEKNGFAVGYVDWGVRVKTPERVMFSNLNWKHDSEDFLLQLESLFFFNKTDNISIINFALTEQPGLLSWRMFDFCMLSSLCCVHHFILCWKGKGLYHTAQHGRLCKCSLSDSWHYIEFDLQRSYTKVSTQSTVLMAFTVSSVESKSKRRLLEEKIALFNNV